MRVNKVDKNIKLLLNSFVENNSLTVNEIKKVLNLKEKKSVYNYLNKLIDSGFKFEKQVSNRVVSYRISYIPHEYRNFKYENVDIDYLIAYFILKSLEKGPLSRKDILKKINLVSKNEKKDIYGKKIYVDEDTAHLITLNIGLSTFNKVFYRLLKENYITKRKSPADNIDRFYLTGINTLSNFRFSYKELNHLSEVIENISAGNPYYKELNTIYERINTLFGEKSNIIENRRHFISYSKINTVDTDIPEFINRISRYNYEKKAVNITFHTEQNGISNIVFATGMLVYSQEKNRLYLMGKIIAQDGNENIIIDAENIISIRETPIKNRYYRCDEFKKMFDSMFSMSIEPEENVEVIFQNIPNIEHRVQQLHVKRKNSRIKVDRNCIYYYDKVSGLSDLADYLKTFGESCLVIKPETLKNIMAASIDRSLERYSKIDDIIVKGELYEK